MATKKEKDYELLYFFLRYEIMAVMLTAVAFALVAIVYVFLDIPANIMELITLIISVIVSLIVSFIAGKETASVITGGCVILIYALLRCLISIIFGFTPILSLRTPFELATGFIVGIIGGIAGCGTTRKRRYR